MKAFELRSFRDECKGQDFERETAFMNDLTDCYPY